MSTRDKLLYDLQAAHMAKDWVLENEIVDALVELDERDERKEEWDKQMRKVEQTKQEQDN